MDWSRERGGEEFNLKIGISMGKGFAAEGRESQSGSDHSVGAAGEMKKVERRGGESSTKRKLKFSGRTHSSLSPKFFLSLS